MRLQKAQLRATRPVLTLFTFQCTACEVVEHRRTHALPQGWHTEEVGSDIVAYCPDCTVDLPERHRQ